MEIRFLFWHAKKINQRDYDETMANYADRLYGNISMGNIQIDVHLS